MVVVNLESEMSHRLPSIRHASETGVLCAIVCHATLAADPS